MDSYYIYQYYPNAKEPHNLSLVIFCSGLTIDVTILKENLRDFFRKNPPPKKIFVLGGHYLKNQLADVFLNNKQDLFDVVPDYLAKEQDIKLLLFDKQGVITLSKKEFNDSDKLLKAGIFSIFMKRGGLIEAPSETYHYVFPSGKHSARFIRAGNVLVHGAEIFFLAISLLSRLKPNVSHIYCDTSSINSLAFAAIELKRRFESGLIPPSIISFGSYEKFENFEFKDSKNSLILISASTSGRIVTRLQEKHPNLQLTNIHILFYLSDDPSSAQIVCDLTYHPETFPDGLRTEQMFDNEVDCSLCKEGSYVVKISGDIFLLEKPKVNSLTINKADAPEFLNRFMRKFHANKTAKLIRCFYGEDQTRTFEIFFKADILLNHLVDLSRNPVLRDEFSKKLDKTIIQHIPTGIKAIIHLDDIGSKVISEMIAKKCKPNKVKQLTTKEFKNQTELKTDDSGSVLVVCSNLVTGYNLLYVSKYLRRFQNLTKTFFVLFARTENEYAFDFIKKNIGQGEFGIATNHFVQIEKITCSQHCEFTNSKKTLSWSQEIELIKKLLSIADENDEFKNAIKFLSERLEILQNASDRETGGLMNDVFIKNPISNKRLKINKNFAFFDFDGYHNKATQADIYFTISTILNSLRHSNDPKKRRIIQEEQVRTLLDPENFIRYDDGVIQASILRSANPEELNYKLSYKHSNFFTSLLLKMIDTADDHQSSEGLVEFLFALATHRVRVYDSHLESILELVTRKLTNQTLLLMVHYMRSELKDKRSAKKSIIKV